MSFDLTPWVEEGSFRQEGYQLEGILKFAHMDHPTSLTLIGRTGTVLDGCSFYFWNRSSQSDDEFPISHLARRQIGPAGLLELGRLEVAEEPDDENPEPQYRASWLLMDWSGQNGYFKIALANPTIEFLEGDHPRSVPKRLLVQRNASSAAVLEGLLPRIVPVTPEKRRVAASPLDEIKEMDRAIESQQPEVPILTLFDPPYAAPERAQLSDNEVELEIKVILAQLARIGVCIDLCRHLTAREFLGMLTDEVLGQSIQVSEFIPIHGMEHFSTYSICPTCQKELEDEMECRESA